MRKIIINIILGSFNCCSLFAQIDFNKHHNTGKGDLYGSILEYNNYYYLSGKNFNASGFGKKYLSKVDMNGDTVFIKGFGTDSAKYYDGTSKNLIHLNNKFYQAGCKIDYTNNLTVPILLITNENGDSLKMLEFYGYDSAVFQTLILDRYGDLLLAGSIAISDGTWQFFLMKTDSLGNIKWTNQYGGVGFEEAYSIDTTIDGNYIMSGFTDSYGSGAWDVYVVKVDSGGVFQWQKYFGSTSNDAGWVKSLDNGQYLIFGGNYVVGYSNQKAFVRKINSNGNLIWHKNFINLTSSSEPFWSMAFDTINNSFIFGGMMFDALINSGNPVGYFVRTDTSGNQIFYRTYKISDNDNYLNDVIISSDNHIVACGYAFPDGAGVLTEDGWIIKLDSVGCLVNGCNLDVDEEKQSENAFIIYPNPNNGVFTIESSSTNFINEKIQFTVYDIMGKEVYSIELKNQIQNTVQINLPGAYYFGVLKLDGNILQTFKVVIE